MAQNPRSADDSPLSAIQLEILLSLGGGPAHGYVIKHDIEQRMGPDAVVGSGSLYQAIHRLERRGLIGEAESSEDAKDGRRGRTYCLEPIGRDALAAELARMDRTLRYAKQHRVGLKEATS